MPRSVDPSIAADYLRIPADVGGGRQVYIGSEWKTVTDKQVSSAIKRYVADMKPTEPLKVILARRGKTLTFNDPRYGYHTSREVNLSPNP